jgi:hypothetical protein
MDVQTERPLRGLAARVMDLVEEVLERAGDVPEVGRRGEDIAVGLEHGVR